MNTTRISGPFAGAMLAGLLAFSATGAHAQLACGGTIGPGGTFEMTTDLVGCPGSRALEVVGPVTLVMNGHAISCSGGLSTGIRIVGRGASVSPGRVRGCLVNVDVGGEGAHKVRNVLIEGAPPVGFGVSSDGNLLDGNSTFGGGNGFQIIGNKNKLTGNVARSSDTIGFLISGSRNTFSRNVAFDVVDGSGFGDAVGFGTDATATGNKFKDNVAANSSIAFDVQGTAQQLTNNEAPGSQQGFAIGGAGGHTLQGNVTVANSGVGTGVGFHISSDDNRLKKNRAQGHFIGFQVAGERNKLTGNQGSGNGRVGAFMLDATDNHLDCDENEWKGNLFHVSSPACVQ